MVGMCVHELIQAQAKVRPDAVALFDGDKRITYRELDQRASQLAARLQASACAKKIPLDYACGAPQTLSLARLVC